MRTNVGDRNLLTSYHPNIFIFIFNNKFTDLWKEILTWYTCFSILLVNADAVLKGTNVNGIYDCHSANDNVVLDHLSFREVASRGISSMDMMAITYCEENGIPGWFNRLILFLVYCWYIKPL